MINSFFSPFSTTVSLFLCGDSIFFPVFCLLSRIFLAEIKYIYRKMTENHAFFFDNHRRRAEMARKDVYERHSTSSCRKEMIASWYHHVGGGALDDPLRNGIMIHHRESVLLPLYPQGRPSAAPTANQNENVSKRRVAEAKSARAVFALATSGSSRYALLHASLVFVLRHAEVPGGGSRSETEGLCRMDTFKRRKFPFIYP